ncbi:class I SAM-dependent methyltransferase [Brumimicrobium aurantiacum]|uniref:class I SAM-dependent methyltransferase n=1 Tax=Brumimicrobium aurantiacum TaxID=1737063 RepID=UPI00196A9BFA|nr:methyltransferase domain-containing protein [Brumimicrobium aurantiacum]
MVRKVLDFGCGFGSDVKLLKEKGVIIEGYDKHYFPDYPTEKFDTIICFYVLNVLLPLDQATVLMKLSQLVKPIGKVYIAVRRDLRNEGYRMHRIHKKETYQCNVVLNSKSIFRNKNCEIYEMEHFTIKNKSNYDLNPFLSGNDYRIPFTESKHFFAFHSKYPQAEYHIILSHKNIVKDTSGFSIDENIELEFFNSFCIDLMKTRFKLDAIEVKESTVNNRLIKNNQWHLQLLG